MPLSHKLVRDITDFISNPSNYRNEWFGDSEIKVYLRACQRYIGENRVTSIDMATVGVSHKRQGLFNELMDLICKLNKRDVTYIENAHNPIIRNWCIKRQWLPDILPDCFYLPTGIKI